MLHRLLGNAQIVVKALGIVQPKAYVRALLVFHQLDCLLCLFRLSLKRSYLRRYLGEDIVGTRHIILGILKLALRLVLFVAIFGNARRVLKDLTALLALPGHHLGDASLTDDGITVTSDTRIHEKLINILESDALAVDKVFTVARAVITAGNRYLVVGTIQFSDFSAVIQRNGYLRVSHGTTAVGTAEDDVLHLGSAQGAGGDLTQNPTHRVRNIGFSRAVGADDNRYTVRRCGRLIDLDLDLVLKNQLCLIGKRLKALHFQ